MARSLKVYGHTSVVSPEIVAALGDASHHRQVSLIVAAPTAAEARRLMGVSASEWRGFGGETGNAEDCAQALAHPGQVFASSINGRRGARYVKVGAGLDHSHYVKLGVETDLALAGALRVQAEDEKAARKAAEAERVSGP